MPPTESEVQDQIGKAIRIFEDLRVAFDTTVAVTPVVDRINALVEALETEYAPEMGTQIGGLRSPLSSAITLSASFMTPLFSQYAQVINETSRSLNAILPKLYEHFADNSLSVNSRDMTFGAPAAGGSNVGNGALIRCNTDSEDNDIENQSDEAKSAECLSDMNSGTTLNEESWRVEGSYAERDAMRFNNTGQNGVLKTQIAGDSEPWVSNPAFSGFSGAVGVGNLTALTDWTVTGAIGNLAVDQTNFFVTYQNEGTPTSLVFGDNETITQDLRVTRNATFNRNIPYHVEIAFNRQIGSGDGTLTLTFGSAPAVNVVLAAQTGWNRLACAISKDSWLDNFNADPLTLSIQLSGRTTGTTRVDNVLVTPFTRLGALGWYQILAGDTSFLLGDTFSWTDSAGVNAVLQYWFYRALGWYLPANNGGAETWADPT